MSDALLRGTASVTFIEGDLITQKPACLDYVAAALSLGWKLAGGGAVNVDDVLIGPLHIQDFRRAQKRQLTRQITFRFMSSRLKVEGESFILGEFIDQIIVDGDLQKAAKKRINYQHYYDQLAAHFKRHMPGYMARDPDAHDRSVIVPVVGNLEWKVRFADQYENGF